MIQNGIAISQRKKAWNIAKRLGKFGLCGMSRLFPQNHLSLIAGRVTLYTNTGHFLMVKGNRNPGQCLLAVALIRAKTRFLLRFGN